jgi:polysaccharide deacetylase 2 family uncharacterized protein YibQ
VSSASPPRSGPRLGSIALILAWLLLLGVLAAAAGYVFLAPEQQARAPGEQPSTAARLPQPTAPGAAPGPAAPESPETTDRVPDTSAIPKVEAPEPEVAEPEVAEAPPTPEPTPEAPEKVPEPAPAEPEIAAPEPLPAPAPEPETAAAPAPPPAPPAPPAAPAPQPEPAPEGEQVAALPRPAPPDARLPWRRNRQPFDEADARPRVAVVLTGLGLASTMTEAAIKELPPGITLSFTPYSRKLNQWIALARVNGHEVMLDLPMEPTSYPDDDPGPQALLTALSARQNLERLRWTLDRATGYVGVAATMGSRFTASEQHMSPILEALKTRGLLFLDNRASEDSVADSLAAEIGVPRTVNDRSLDRVQASRIAIDARLLQLENVARAQGFAVAMGRPYPVTIERLRDWAQGLQARGLALAPISALADRQPLRRTAERKPQTE